MSESKCFSELPLKGYSNQHGVFIMSHTILQHACTKKKKKYVHNICIYDIYIICVYIYNAMKYILTIYSLSYYISQYIILNLIICIVMKCLQRIIILSYILCNTLYGKIGFVTVYFTTQ